MIATPHTDREYEQQLVRLQGQIQAMGNRVDEMIGLSIRALVERDSDLARRVIDDDRHVDLLELEADHLCLTILALRQPVASDLRCLTTALKIVTDLERIGDLCVNVCERIIELNVEPQLKPYIDLPKMAEVVQLMIRESLAAFEAGNTDRALAVLERDHTVDAYYGQIFRELLTYMMADPKAINRSIKVQSIAKYIERMGDHATNLAEMVIFMVRGKDIRHVGSTQANPRPHGVLFLCVHNTARSQMAEAWANKLFPGAVHVWSAGSSPVDQVDPRAVKVMQEVGIDISEARPKKFTVIPLGSVDTIITLCADEICPMVPGIVNRLSWEMPDPTAAAGTDAEKLDAFRKTRDELHDRIEKMVKSWG